MGKRILFSLSFSLICFGALLAQTDNSPTSKPVTVVTPKGITTKKTLNVKPVFAGKGIGTTTTKPVATAPTATPTVAKTATKAVIKTPEKPKTKTVAKSTTKKVKAKTTTKAVAEKAPVKAKAPVKVKTAEPTPTTQIKSVPTQYAATAVKTAPKNPVTTPKAAIPMSFNQEMLSMVNALRKSGTMCGGEKMPAVKPLVWDTKLENAAIAHATDMDANDHFSHAGTNGTLPDERITKAGYEWARVGENIGQGYKNVAAAMKGWKESTNHCKQMMNAEVTNIGAAKKGKYWCQTFASALE